MGYLFVIAAVISTSLALVSYKKYTISAEKLYLLLTISLFMFAPVLNFSALQYLTVDIVYMGSSLNGLIVLVLSHYYLDERVIARQFAGAILVFIGVLIYMM